MQVGRGFRHELKSKNLVVSIKTKGSAEYDVSCFGLDSNEKLSDDRYMIFYNQMTSPNYEIVMESKGDSTDFRIDLSRLPDSMNKLVFTVNTDDSSNQPMCTLNSLDIILADNAGEGFELNLTGSDFKEERALIACEVYKYKGDWKVNMVARGFNGGLRVLLKTFGGEEETSTSQNVETAVKKVSLEKKLEDKAPGLVSLVKPIKVCLDKHKLNEVEACVAVVLDISGSMNCRYKSGAVQRIINKTLPLAVQFDDDGSMDFWFFGTTCKKMQDLNLDNYETATSEWKTVQRQLGGCNDEVLVMKEVIDRFKNSSKPAYVLFVSDGGIHKGGKIKKLMQKASLYPIFWQFMGVGGNNYSILEKLDDMDGRVVDNANFFAIDDFDSVPNDELYDRLLNEFPSWLKEAKAKRIIR